MGSMQPCLCATHLYALSDADSYSLIQIQWNFHRQKAHL